jgi:glycosyltransferase involved in cell wall biosynthesis
MLQISVIIPNFNRAGALEGTLTALAEQTISPEAYEVVVVDDGSTDESVEVIAEMEVPYSLKLVRQSNRGAGAARNRGARFAQSDLLVFLDADMIAMPDLLQHYLAADAHQPDALIIGRQRPCPDAYPTLFDKVTRYEGFRDLGPEPFTPSFYHVLSSSMSVRRANYDKVGGFDEGVGIGAHPATDDTEFGYRAQKMGLDLVYCPKAVAYHNHPRTLEQRCIQEYTIALWTARMFQRYPEMRSLIPAFRDVQLISWRKDPLVLIGWKAARRFLALRPVLSTLKFLARAAERWWPNPRLLRFLYWKILSGYRVVGFRKGLSPT